MACDITFADVHDVKCTLHAYAKQPLHLRGQQVFVFQKCAKLEGSVEEESAAECCHCGYSDTVSPTSLGLVLLLSFCAVPELHLRGQSHCWLICTLGMCQSIAPEAISIVLSFGDLVCLAQFNQCPHSLFIIHYSFSYCLLSCCVFCMCLCLFRDTLLSL